MKKKSIGVIIGSCNGNNHGWMWKCPRRQKSSKDDGEKGGYKIGLTNSFNGNSYRQQMEAYAQEAADELSESGEISEFVIVEANNDASKQVQQIENFYSGGHGCYYY